MKRICYGILLIIFATCTIIGCRKDDSLSKAECLSFYDCVDSLATSWVYIQEANTKTKKVVGLDIAKTIVHKVDSLFDNYLRIPDLDNAAKCLDIMGQIISYYGEMYFIPELSDNSSIEEHGTTSKLEKLDRHRERLADAYYQQARSAEKLWTKYKDLREQQRMKDSDEKAHKYNPNKY